MKKVWDDFRKKRALAQTVDAKPALPLNLKARVHKQGDCTRTVTSPYNIPQTVTVHMGDDGWAFALGYLDDGEPRTVRKISDGVWAEEGKRSHRLYSLMSIVPSADPIDSFCQWTMVKGTSPDPDSAVLALKAIERGMSRRPCPRQKLG